MRKRAALKRLPVLVSTALWLSSNVLAQARTIGVIAGKDNRFRLANGVGVLILKAGEKVHFKLISGFGGEKGRDGSVHSFVVKKLRDQGWDIRLKEGVQEFDLTAPSPGEYLIECTVKCGPGHDTMNLKMVVQS